MPTVYGDKYSGNCYKIQLLLSHLETEYDWVDIDILAGETRTEPFLAMNSSGRIPLLQLDNGKFLPESNAILNYFAQDTAYLPQDALRRAQVLQWQFFEQYSHEPNIAVARFIAKYQGMPKERQQEYDAKQQGGIKALDVMDKHLSSNTYFVDNTLSIADFSLYAYTHVAHEGGFDLRRFANINAWLERVESHAMHVPMGV